MNILNRKGFTRTDGDDLVNKWDFSSLEEQMRKVQPEKRFRHTLGVTYTACALAMRYEEDIEVARVAGLLHDCAKFIPVKEQLSLADTYDIEISLFERKHPQLLHAKVGSILAKFRYGIDNTAVQDAIRWHTTGRPDMSTMEKILFIADYIEPNRDRAPRLQEIRTMAFKDLDHAALMILEDTVAYLSEDPTAIDTITLETLQFYKKGKKE